MAPIAVAVRTSFATVKVAWKRWLSAEAVVLARQLFGLLHLADDLRFAEDHGVQTRGDAEGVAGGLFLLKGVDVGLEFRERHALLVRNVGEHRAARGLGILHGAVELRAVAGGEHGGFADAALGRGTEALDQVRDRRADLFGPEGHTLAHGDGGRRVIET